ncbi:hypothetical protein MJO28_000204 [Puccinia striiformis f. sp. tritici]|uniref:Uncharacterized protein n=1 Tax=Puccinia striiformis f. sp. tritici TaxID=168172 RepID=A0ACC0EYY8_9BASI|nr:hypothetical protein Pst134EB_002224 [Puccinia striiformis f. sp. tritici]KAI7962110.1 hypothetical protein MJO28_000204 [Puccinia striiformis f. sp. tritici]
MKLFYIVATVSAAIPIISAMHLDPAAPLAEVKTAVSDTQSDGGEVTNAWHWCGEDHHQDKCPDGSSKGK